MRFQVRYQEEILDDFEAPSANEAVLAPEAIRAQREHGLVLLEPLGGGEPIAESVAYRKGAELLFGWQLLGVAAANTNTADDSGEFPVVRA